LTRHVRAAPKESLWSDVVSSKGMRKGASWLTCNQVFDAFLTHCETRMAMNDLAYSTVHGYQQILDSVWRPQIGGDVFEQVRYSQLASIAAAHTQKKEILQQRRERPTLRVRRHRASTSRIGLVPEPDGERFVAYLERRTQWDS
jgi:hypothetical protein